jgi:hypothetical protein
MAGVGHRAVALGLVLVTAACGGADAPPPAGGDEVTLHGYGLTISVPPGWEGEISRGAVRLANRSLPPREGGPRQLDAGALVVEVLEREPTPDEWGGIEAVEGPPVLEAGDFAAPESGTAPEDHAVARRFLSLAGRVFVLFAEAGARPVAEDAVREASAALATLEVEPGDFYPGAVEPATFVPAPGWHTGHSGRFERRPWGEQTQSWAATVPYADGPFDLPPRETIERLTEDGVLVWVGLSRAWDPAAPGERYPVRERPYRLADFEVHPTWEGQVRDVPKYELRTRVEDQYEVDVRVYFGRATPTAAMRAGAEDELERLRLPDWGPWELE